MNGVGEDAPKTNVARDAVERTQLVPRYARAYYDAIIDFVNQEIKAKAKRINASHSSAAIESQWMTNVLFERRASALDATAYEHALASLKCWVVETEGKRNVFSLDEFRSNESIVTLHSPIVNDAELMLRRTGADTGLRALMGLLNYEGVNIPDTPIIVLPTLSHTRNWLLSKLIPKRVSIDDDMNSLSVHWSADPQADETTFLISPMEGLDSVIDFAQRSRPSSIISLSMRRWHIISSQPVTLDNKRPIHGVNLGSEVLLLAT